LDADKEGFLRSTTSLIQTMGRAARNVSGRVILYADVITDSMRRAMAETERRQALQRAYNAEHGIDPQTIRKAVTDLVAQFRSAAGTLDEGAPMPAGHKANAERSRRAGRRATDRVAATLGIGPDRYGGDSSGELPAEELDRLIEKLEGEMHAASAELRFEYAARLRDEIRTLRRELREVG
ncbi:MAG TPA: UvrB/UvrC motif-containing protein, partial [Acidimicrobiales bacterium]|nr:UvrB/UvrC motif-containing protein [Acidimicrobiales bacterium]